jgi:cytochrome c oxidase cbb3-type subunit 3/ubiquinol-cytochrome c reductase cytochrome c subunit
VGETTDFRSLYRENCAGCHGANGKNGAAIALANPVYVAWAGRDQLRSAITNGSASKLMPPFARSTGGMLTDNQVSALVNGIADSWGTPNPLTGVNPPAYKGTLAGDPQRGFTDYGEFCARCHGTAGEGGPADGKNIPGRTGPGRSGWLGSIVDPSYLALIGDQSLRTLIVAGLPDSVMPDWRSDAAQPMSDQQVTDVVAWLASKRVATPGQPYPAHP